VLTEVPTDTPDTVDMVVLTKDTVVLTKDTVVLTKDMVLTHMDTKPQSQLLLQSLLMLLPLKLKKLLEGPELSVMLSEEANSVPGQDMVGMVLIIKDMLEFTPVMLVLIPVMLVLIPVMLVVMVNNTEVMDTLDTPEATQPTETTS